MSNIIKIYGTRSGYVPPSIIAKVPRQDSPVSTITITVTVVESGQPQVTYSESWSSQTIFGGTFDMISGEAFLLQNDGSYIRQQGTANQISLALGWNLITARATGTGLSVQCDVEATRPDSVTGNSFSIDGVSSDLFGVGLSGTGVWDAPARKGESISVPGRNGNIWVDDGSFENVLVTYPCWLSKDFAGSVGDFRNFLSRNSEQYHKISDTYNPNEYRLGRYAGAFTPTPGTSNETGKFDVVFDCMPQRFLNSGATWRELTIPDKNPAQEVANLLTETNPTGFKAAPVLMVSVTDALSQDYGALIDLSIRNDAQNRYNFVQVTRALPNTYYYIDCENFVLREGYVANFDQWESCPIAMTARLNIVPASGTYTDYTAMLYEGVNVINNRTQALPGQSYTNLARFSILTRYWTI